MKVKIIITFLVVLAVLAGGAVGGFYLKNWQRNVEREKIYLQERVANLDKQNKVLKKAVNKLVEQNKKAAKLIKKVGKNTETKKEVKAATDEKKIESLVWVNLKSQRIDSKFKKVKVKRSGVWATADAIPKDITNNDGLTYLFKERDGEWKLLNYGTGLSREDYPASPSKIWR